MFRLLADVFHFLLWWCFLYVGSFMLLILGIVYITKTNPTPPTPIINEYYSTVTHQVVAPPKKVIVEEEICTRIDGCRIIDNVCVDCLTVKN